MFVLFSGPEYIRVYMEALADAVMSDDITILHHYDLKTPSDCERWTEVNVLVTLRQACSDDDMARAPSLCAIITPTLGLEGIDIDAAARRGISLGNGRVP